MLVNSFLKSSKSVLMSVTILSLFGLLILVFIGTLLQIKLDIHEVESTIISSFIIYAYGIPVFPGGATFSTLLLASLTYTFWMHKYWKKPSLLLIHIGFTLLILGEILRIISSSESYMILKKGEPKNYAESSTHFELALIDYSPIDYNRIISIPLTGINQSIKIPGTALTIKVSDHTYALNEFDQWPLTIGTRQFENYDISIRPQRTYFPFELQLVEFHQETHPGTSIPKSFSSDILVLDEKGQQDRDATIAMNNPLNYRGRTFYQSSFEDSGTASVLHVVENRWKLIPYISLGMIATGLVLHALKMFRRNR